MGKFVAMRWSRRFSARSVSPAASAPIACACSAAMRSRSAAILAWAADSSCWRRSASSASALRLRRREMFEASTAPAIWPISSLRPTPGKTTSKLPAASSRMPRVRPPSGPVMPRATANCRANATASAAAAIANLVRRLPLKRSIRACSSRASSALAARQVASTCLIATARSAASAAASWPASNALPSSSNLPIAALIAALTLDKARSSSPPALFLIAALKRRIGVLGERLQSIDGEGEGDQPRVALGRLGGLASASAATSMPGIRTVTASIA